MIPPHLKPRVYIVAIKLFFLYYIIITLLAPMTPATSSHRFVVAHFESSTSLGSFHRQPPTATKK